MSRKLGPLAALAMVALIGAGCSNDPAENGGAGNTSADYENAVKFSECLRDNGVSEFPDPDASGSLHELGYDADAGVGVDPDDNDFTWETEEALEELQDDKGLNETGALDVDDAVFLPESARIAKVTGELGGSASPGARVAQATSDTLEVQVELEASQQGVVKEGDRAEITLPGNKSVKGKVDRLGESPRRLLARTTTSGTRRSRPLSVSTSQGRRAGSTRPRSRWTSRPRE
jgi:hypothetical protein